jgi:hypothetical protein
MMNLGMEQRFHLVANFHGGAEVVNYPWDHQYTLHTDDAWYQSISRAYASSAQANSPSGYLEDLNNGITNAHSGMLPPVTARLDKLRCQRSRGYHRSIQHQKPRSKYPAGLLDLQL